METTRKRYGAGFKAKVALWAIRLDPTLADLGMKHSLEHTETQHRLQSIGRYEDGLTGLLIEIVSVAGSTEKPKTARNPSCGSR